ncbi:caskin-2 isoform X1 [Drosophila miranda]|uniref:caskin-2 isoform X1 n=1 Tax=Drosophila miranda TaxID=7229 RepID=UPI00143FA3B2|nr:caskin-2 isoform X1 [Drosophila miranda]XP_033253443.1 caskin-2 isoform X1 [Drosophila miranda]XP_033253444.1 caskin-2 isoform X1 [Drosophila miranda]
MHRSLKPHTSTAQAKKVQPPTIPGDPLQQQLQQHHQHYHPLQQLPASPSGGHHQPSIPLYRLSGPLRHHHQQQQQTDDGISMSGSSIVSSPSLEEGGFNLPRETSVALRMKDEAGGGPPMAVTGGPVPPAAAKTSAPLPSILPCPSPVFCATLREPLTHKAAVYYHQQLALQEDQGIDLTQSPGRDSPGSSSGSAGSGSRHSTASLDSGRASSYLTGVSSSGASVRAPLSSPRCSSVSSCSIGSVDRQRNDELIIDWLLEMKHEEYAQLFIAAGYDLPTIARMTPEDLTAIGIKNPHHRERIKQRIDKLQVLDNLPHFVPGSIEEWLQLLRLEEYIQPLLEQNYKTVRDVTQVTWEDLEDIGIVKLGHQKKILLAIKRVKDIISGKWNPGGASAYQQQEYQREPWQFNVPIPSTPSYVPTTRVSWDDTKIYATSNVLNNTAPTGSLCLGQGSSSSSSCSSSNGDAYYCTGSNHECCSGNDVVLIKVRQPRGKSLESLEDIHDNSTRSHLTFSHYTTTDYGLFGPPTTAAAAAAMAAAATLQQQHQHHHQQLLQQQQAAPARLLGSNAAAMAWRRSYDDGDITPTNDATRELLYEEGGGTLPRQQRGILQRAVLNTMPPLKHHHYMNAAAAAEYGAASGGEGGANYLSGSPLSGKKIAPEPPRRHCSIRNSRTLSGEGGATGSVQQPQQQAVGSQQQQQQHAHQMFYRQQQQAAAAAAAAAGSQQPIYANYATIQQTTAEIHCEKYHDNKSTSSIDSIDAIPFANENTGTIKQRLLNRQELGQASAGATTIPGSHPPHLYSSSSSSSSSSTNTIANIGHSFHSLKSSSSLHDATLARSESMGSTASGGSALHLRSPTLDAGIGGSSASMPASGEAMASPETAAPVTSVPPKVSVNVLNDIGNMLANLTDELDAMLEEEKRVGLNIDSE